MRIIGQEAWMLYSVMVVYSVNGVCNASQLDLMGALGVGKTALNNRLKRLRASGAIERVDEGTYRLLETIPTEFTIAVTYINNSVYNVKDRIDVDDVYNVSTYDTSTTLPTSPTPITPPDVPSVPTKSHEVLRYWTTSYESAFGAKYVPSNWGNEMKRIKTLQTRYTPERLTAIIDVVMRLYPRLWSSAAYPRPTLGQMQSWLAAQAEAYVQTNGTQDTLPAMETTGNDGGVESLVERGWI